MQQKRAKYAHKMQQKRAKYAAKYAIEICDFSALCSFLSTR